MLSMSRHHKGIAIMCALIFLLPLLMCGCEKEWETKKITDVNNLGGMMVGVNMGWAADYALTHRSDMELYRYDSTADLMMALNYNKVDAIATDDMSWVLMSKNSTGLVKVEPEIQKTGYVWYFRDKELCDQINEFIAEFKKTDTYKEFREREDNFNDDYEQPEIELTGKGKTLRVAFDPTSYPRSFVKVGDTELYGFDGEQLKYFANEHDYQLEFIPSTGNDGMMGLQNGMYDVLGGYISVEFNDEAEKLGLFVSDTMDEGTLVFVQKLQNDISVDIDNLE